MSKIDNLFAPIVGELVWSVRRGHGSFLTMEFGQHHLEAREPIQKHVQNRTGSKVNRQLRRRGVFAAGQWSLWIQHAEWKVAITGETRGFDDSNADIDSVLQEIDGQKLVSVAET